MSEYVANISTGKLVIGVVALVVFITIATAWINGWKRSYDER